jgi:hypothetical protein
MEDCKGSVRKRSQANGSTGVAFALKGPHTSGPPPLRSNGHLETITHEGGAHTSVGRYKWNTLFGTLDNTASSVQIGEQ